MIAFDHRVIRQILLLIVLSAVNPISYYIVRQRLNSTYKIGVLNITILLKIA
jgi:hypothetical protein